VHLGPKVRVNGNAHRHVVGVIPDTTFVDGATMRLFDEQRVGGHLNAVGSPGLTVAGLASRSPALVLVGEQLAAPKTQNIHRAAKTKVRALEGQPLDRLALLLCELNVHPPARVDGGIGDAKSLDLLEVEEALAVDQRVQRGHAQQGIVHERRISSSDPAASRSRHDRVADSTRRWAGRPSS
jgi:hypothetical protein